MSKMPEDGAEKIYFVVGENCIRVYDWNEHYIKENAIENVIIFDVSNQKYYNWKEFVDTIHSEQATLGISPEDLARKNLKRLRYKVYMPVQYIPRKKALKTKKKIENNFVCTPSAGN